MKSLKTAMLFALIFCVAAAKAQSSQAPHLFDAFSNSINCNSTELEKIFSIAEGSLVQVPLSQNFVFKGNIISSIQRYGNMKSVLIKSSNFNGAIFSVSKRTNEDTSITYVGRILSENHADGYELIKENDNYYLNKIKFAEILQDK